MRPAQSESSSSWIWTHAFRVHSYRVFFPWHVEESTQLPVAAGQSATLEQHVLPEQQIPLPQWPLAHSLACLQEAPSALRGGASHLPAFEHIRPFPQSMPVGIRECEQSYAHWVLLMTDVSSVHGLPSSQVAAIIGCCRACGQVTEHCVVLITGVSSVHGSVSTHDPVGWRGVECMHTYVHAVLLSIMVSSVHGFPSSQLLLAARMIGLCAQTAVHCAALPSTKSSVHGSPSSQSRALGHG